MLDGQRVFWKSSQSMIVFDKVSKRFGNTDAVKEFSLTIQEREILGLLGPNGAGKSTLMLMMGTVYRPTGGRITVHGFDVEKQSNEVRKLIGIAFQDARVDGILGAFDVLNWHLKMTTALGKQEREKRVEEVLRTLDLWEARNKRTWLMSGGMKKKVEDAKVLVQRPKIAVFDEPTAFLDVPSRLLMWKMIRELRDEGSTVIVATNMMDEAERLSDNVAIVNLGRLVATGTSEQLKKTQKGGEILELTVGDGVEVSRELLTQFSEVLDVSHVENKIVIYLNSGRLMLPRIVEALTVKGVKIDSVHLKEVTLEDVFLSYTGQRLD
jgi:ABC-2 type transport system ATP-binding protein